MPNVLRVRGYTFFFFSREELEPPHIHVRSAQGFAKFWLGPVSLAKSTHYSQREVHQIAALVELHREDFLRAWNEYFNP